MNPIESATTRELVAELKRRGNVIVGWEDPKGGFFCDGAGSSPEKYYLANCIESYIKTKIIDPGIASGEIEKAK